MTSARPYLQHHRDAPPPDPYAPMDLTLPDILAPGLDLVFVGINPSIYSAERGQYFARPSNMFWRCLNASGLLPVPLGPADSHRLPEFGIGLTDIVKRATHDAAQLSRAEFAEGREELHARLLANAPRAACFVGKLAYQHFSGRRALPFGLQAESLGETALFVMPSTSGLVNNLHAERLRVLAEVRAFLGR
jgi:TDG/mug DNA glycosylase family protein